MLYLFLYNTYCLFLNCTSLNIITSNNVIKASFFLKVYHGLNSKSICNEHLMNAVKVKQEVKLKDANYTMRLYCRPYSHLAYAAASYNSFMCPLLQMR